MSSYAAIAELPVAALKPQDENAVYAPLSSVFEKPARDRLWLVEIETWDTESGS